MPKIDTTVGNLVAMIKGGELRLPEMQRRYVWPSTRVRDLLDSLSKDFHVAQSKLSPGFREEVCTLLPWFDEIHRRGGEGDGGDQPREAAAASDVNESR